MCQANQGAERFNQISDIGYMGCTITQVEISNDMQTKYQRETLRNKLKTKLMPPGAEEEMAHMALGEAILEKP